MPVRLSKETREKLTAVDFVKGLLHDDFTKEFDSAIKSESISQDSKYEDFVKEYESDIHTAFVSLYSGYKDLYPDEVVDAYEISFNPRQILNLSRFLVSKCVSKLKKKGTLKMSVDSLRGFYRDYFDSGKTDSIFFEQFLEGYEDTFPVLSGDISKPCKSEHLMVRSAGEGICIEADIFTILSVPDAVISRMFPQYKICFMVLKALTKKALYNNISSLLIDFSVTFIAHDGVPHSEVTYSVPFDLYCRDNKGYREKLREMRDSLKEVPEFTVSCGDFNLKTTIDQFISLLDALLSYE